MQSVRVHHEGTVAVVTLDRPPANAMDAASLNELADVFDRLASDADAGADVTAIVLTGEGRSFSAGLDLKPGLDPEHEASGLPRFDVALDRYGVCMSATERVEYDEFGLFHENAAEHGLPFDGPPAVRREHVEVEPGRRLSALVWGLGDPELVLLHGGSQNAHTWDTVAMALRPRSLIAIDLPGHGHSDGPGERQRADHSPRGAADDVAVVIRALAPNTRGVVGMSYGGLTTIALTECAPDVVRKVLLVDVLPGLKAEHARHIVDFVNGPATFARFDDLLARTMEFNPTRSISSLRRGILHNAVQLDDGSWVWRHSRWRLGADEHPESEAIQRDGAVFDDLLDTLGRIQVPLLLARGMRPDSVLRDDDEAELLSRLPSAQVVHFEEAGHSIQGDMPVQLAATIQTFIP